jgi:hypothetical protein
MEKSKPIMSLKARLRHPLLPHEIEHRYHSKKHADKLIGKTCAVYISYMKKDMALKRLEDVYGSEKVSLDIDMINSYTDDLGIHNIYKATITVNGDMLGPDGCPFPINIIRSGCGDSAKFKDGHKAEPDKAAITDAIKRALSHYGIGNELNNYPVIKVALADGKSYSDIYKDKLLNLLDNVSHLFLCGKLDSSDTVYLYKEGAKNCIAIKEKGELKQFPVINTSITSKEHVLLPSSNELRINSFLSLWDGWIYEKDGESWIELPRANYYLKDKMDDKAKAEKAENKRKDFLTDTTAFQGIWEL